LRSPSVAGEASGWSAITRTLAQAATVPDDWSEQRSRPPARRRNLHRISSRAGYLRRIARIDLPVPSENLIRDDARVGVW
jgi:hypothetical protein